MGKGGGTLHQSEELRAGYGFLPTASFVRKKKIPVQGVEVSHLRGELLMLPTVLAGRAALPGATSPRGHSGALSIPGPL